MMKKLDDYMAMPYRIEIVEDKEEGGFVVSYPDLPGCITCGETVESAVTNALDAKKHGLKQRQKLVQKFMSQIVSKTIQGSLN